MKEVWAHPPDSNEYEVSSYGRVRRISFKNRMTYFKYKKPRGLKLTENDRGYYGVCICVNNKKFHRMVHVLVALTFLGPRPNPKIHCAHLDGNSKNNNIKNLKWVTAKENEHHKFLHGKRAMGSRSGPSKLNEKQVKFILESPLSNADLSRKFKIYESTISQIRLRRTWRHVEFKKEIE